MARNERHTFGAFGLKRAPLEASAEHASSILDQRLAQLGCRCFLQPAQQAMRELRTPCCSRNTPARCCIRLAAISASAMARCAVPVSGSPPSGSGCPAWFGAAGNRRRDNNSEQAMTGGGCGRCAPVRNPRTSGRTRRCAPAAGLTHKLGHLVHDLVDRRRTAQHRR